MPQQVLRPAKLALADLAFVCLYTVSVCAKYHNPLTIGDGILDAVALLNRIGQSIEHIKDRRQVRENKID